MDGLAQLKKIKFEKKLSDSFLKYLLKKSKTEKKFSGPLCHVSPPQAKPRRHLTATDRLLFPCCLCDSAPTPSSQTDADTSPPSLTRDETKLLDALHAELLDHRRVHPESQVTFEPLPSLPEVISGLLPSPPPAHPPPLRLFHRLLELCHLVPALPADSLPDLYAAMIDLLAKHHHFQQAQHLLEEMRERALCKFNCNPEFVQSLFSLALSPAWTIISSRARLCIVGHDMSLFASWLVVPLLAPP
jgi:hypothetical protein